ncbi:MAG TPA: DNA internalization-related competence protein ComEC/Rec2 [Kofleriaceae bacterium]|jgi:competence protein ComEC
MRLRLPPPLPCALVFAAVLAIVGPRGASVPDGAVPDDRGEETVAGTIGAPVEHGPRGYGAPLDTGATVVWIWTGRAVLPGQRVFVTGRLRTPRGLLDPGAPDRAAMLASRGASWELTASHVEVVADEPGLRDRTWRWAGATQAKWAGAIDDGTPAGAALAGIVSGDRRDVPDALDQRWRACGIYHVLSVSGLHLAVVAGLLALLLRKLIAASPWGGRVRPARAAALPALAAAIAYTMITGAQLATVRALVVVAIVLIAQAIDRPVRLVDALGLAAIAILAWRPGDIRDPSFQLSFVAALVLAVQVRAPRRPGVLGWIARGTATSAWIALATAPITAYHFHQIQPGGIIGNLVLAPALELVALPLALAGAIIGCGPAIDIARWIVARIDDLAALGARGLPVGTIGVASAAVMAALVALAVVLATRRVRGKLVAVLWLALCGLWLVARTPPPAHALRVTFLDVGQGTATLVELPDGATWLVDAGGLASAPDLAVASSPGRAIAGTLAAYGHTRVDLAVLSHPHPDHYLGFVALADALPIDELWSADERELPPGPPPRARTAGLPSFAEVAASLAARGTRLVHPPLGVARREAGVELVVWAPRYVAADGAPAVEAADPVRTVNDNSLVVAIRYAGRTILLPGDLEAEGEAELVAAGLPHVDAVAVPHHGSPTSSTPALVAAAHPELAVISCGLANHFGFPAPAVVARWRAAGAAVERTDLAGAVTVTIDDAGGLAISRFAR